MDGTLTEKLKALRLSHGLTQSDFGQIAGVSDKAVSTWEAGLKTPRIGALKQIATHFHLNLNDLVDDIPLSFSVASNPSSEIGQRISSLRKQKGLTLDDIANAARISRSTVLHYEHGDFKHIKFPVLSSIAAALGTSPEYLYGETSSPYPDNAQTTIDENLLLNYYRSLSQRGKDKLLEYASDLISSNNYSNE